MEQSCELGGYSRMIPAAVLLCGEFMSVDSAEMDMAGTAPPPRHILSIKVGGCRFCEIAEALF